MNVVLVLVYLPLLTAVVVLVVVCGLEWYCYLLIMELKIVLRLSAYYLELKNVLRLDACYPIRSHW